MTSVYTFKMKIPKEGIAQKNSLSRRTEKLPNLKKIHILMF